MPDLNPDYSKRNYLLPPGCKDLVDVLNLTKQQSIADGAMPYLVPTPTYSAQDFTVELGPSTTVKNLAEILHLKPLTIIGGLMELGVFANINQAVDFDSAAKLLAKYGYFAIKPA